MTHVPDRARLERLAACVYFVQGSLGLAGVAFPLFLRKAGMEIHEITLLSAITGAPWFFKLIYGVLSDAIPWGGYRRKSYLMASAAAGAGGWFLLAALPFSFPGALVAGLISNLGFAFTDVVTDGLIVEHSDAAHAKRYQALTWGARSLGAFLMGVVGGWLAGHIPYRAVFALTGLLPIATITLARGYPEIRSEQTVTRSDFLQRCWVPVREAVRMLMKSDLLWFSLLLFILSFNASVNTPLFFFFKEQLGFSETFLGLLTTLGWAGAAAGCWIFVAGFQHVALRRALAFAVLFTVLNTLIYLWVYNRISGVVVSFSGGMLYYLAYLPLLSCAARMAHNTGAESSLLALYMSINNLGVIVATAAGGYLASALGLRVLIVCAGVVAALGYPIVRKLRSV